ncbi:MAG: hypothetical protein RBT16_14545 [Desulfococcus multivorans]|jgi:hypothetical protein|nr:hypothetical protein [Desulfococcus multivorans]
MQKYQSESSGPAKNISASAPENDDSQQKAALMAKIFYLIMGVATVGGVIALFWLALKFAQ